MSGEVFNNQSKTSYDKETAKSFKYADLTYKICKTLKDRVEAMITPNPGMAIYIFNLTRCLHFIARRIGKKIKDEFKLAVLEDLQKSEKLAVVTKESAYDLPGTDLCAQNVFVTYCIRFITSLFEISLLIYFL